MTLRSITSESLKTSLRTEVDCLSNVIENLLSLGVPTDGLSFSLIELADLIISSFVESLYLNFAVGLLLLFYFSIIPGADIREVNWLLILYLFWNYLCFCLYLSNQSKLRSIAAWTRNRKKKNLKYDMLVNRITAYTTDSKSYPNALPTPYIPVRSYGMCLMNPKIVDSASTVARTCITQDIVAIPTASSLSLKKYDTISRGYAVYQKKIKYESLSLWGIISKK